MEDVPKKGVPSKSSNALEVSGVGSMWEYYRERAEEYETIYSRKDPIQQREQQLVLKALRSAMQDRDVLDLGSGTGYWSSLISGNVLSLVGLDYVDTVIIEANLKSYKCPTSFCLGDVNNPPFRKRVFDGIMILFLYSHLPRRQINAFLEGLHKLIRRKSRIFIADNVYVPSLGGELVAESSSVDTFKLRSLTNRKKFKIIKNYYGKSELFNQFSRFDPMLSKKDVFFGERYWFVSYQTDNL